MNKFEKLIPDHVRELKQYLPGKPLRQAEQESGVRCIKMASNENPLGPSPKALAAMAAAAAASSFYPDNECSRLRLQLAQEHDLDLDQVLVTDGTTAFLDIIARTLLRPGLKAVTSERSFIVYPIVTQSAGGRLVEVPMKGDSFDLDAIAAAIDSDTRIIFLANPNNPTGTIFDAAAADAFLRRLPDHVIVVLDEAYCDFATYFAGKRGIEYTHSLDYVRQGRNVIVLRTFSKAHGLAGLRVGYGFGPPELLQHFSRVRTAFSVSNVAEAAALAAMQDEEHIRKTIANNAAGVEWLTRELAALGITAGPTFGNFLYFQVDGDAVAFARRMQGEGVIVRALGAWGIPRGIRVTVGTPEQNRIFIAALKKSTERAVAR